MDKPQKIAIKAYSVTLFKTDDDNFLLVDKEGKTKVHTNGLGLLKDVRNLFEIQADIL